MSATPPLRDLTKAYRFLRTLEHRLQMIEDEQTHTVPKTPQGVAHIACFMGLCRRAKLRAWRCSTELETVQGHYARLFERAAPLGVGGRQSRLHRRGGRSRNA